MIHLDDHKLEVALGNHLKEGGPLRYKCLLCVNPQEARMFVWPHGGFKCHYCEAHGKIVDYSTVAETVSANERDLTAYRFNQMNRLFRESVPVTDTPGEFYLKARGIPCQVAVAAGVRYIDDDRYPGALVFPMRNANARLVAIEVKGLSDGETLATWGHKTRGLFSTSTEALTSSVSYVCESAIDALSLAAIERPSVATFGASCRPHRWVLDLLKTKQSVYLCQDNDDEGRKSREAFNQQIVVGNCVYLIPPITECGNDINALLQGCGFDLSRFRDLLDHFQYVRGAS